MDGRTRPIVQAVGQQSRKKLFRLTPTLLMAGISLDVSEIGCSATGQRRRR